MRMILPPLKERRVVDRLLSSFFHEYKAQDFKRAISLLCRFYHLKNPKVDWFEYIDWGKTAGKTYENGQIYLIHPENWKNGRKYRSEEHTSELQSLTNLVCRLLLEKKKKKVNYINKK